MIETNKKPISNGIGFFLFILRSINKCHANYDNV